MAWLLLNLCGHADIIEYGTSPRFGWLTDHGYRLKAYIDSRATNELVKIVTDDGGAPVCFPDWCNCTPEEGAPCHNPFWREAMNRAG